MNKFRLEITEISREESRYRRLRSYFQVVRALKLESPGKSEVYYLEAMSPHEVLNRLKAIGLRPDWVFADFDEVITEQSSQQIWAKHIVMNHKGAFPDILWKYIHHFKWKENLYELNKIFRYADGIKELEANVIPHLKFNENAERILNRLREEKINSANPFRKAIYKFFKPVVNLVIVSCNTGMLIKLFLQREDIRKRLIDNKIVVRAVVANQMGLDKMGNITGLSHNENVIDINTKEEYIPENPVVLVDKRDSRLKQSHAHAIFVPSGSSENKISELKQIVKRFHILKYLPVKARQESSRVIL